MNPDRCVLRDLDVHLAEREQIDLGLPFEGAEGREQRDAHGDAADAEPAGQRQSVAAVVALAADDAHAHAGEAVEEALHLGHDPGCRVLHQDRPGDAEVLDRPAVDVPDLLCGDDLHDRVSVDGRNSVVVLAL